MRMDWRRNLWYSGWLALLLLSLDFWNWGSIRYMFFGIPCWVVCMLIITVLLSMYYQLFSRTVWGEDDD
ncbi:MAG: hypothetical protein ABIH11_08130 [Candidatus Altiarchaeota archaeon]